jgi:hypothetical protein
MGVSDEARTRANGTIIGAAIAISAGTFLAVATSGILPQIRRENAARLAPLIALFVGLGVSWIGRMVAGGLADRNRIDAALFVAQTGLSRIRKIRFQRNDRATTTLIGIALATLLGTQHDASIAAASCSTTSSFVRVCFRRTEVVIALDLVYFFVYICQQLLK